MDPLLTQGSTAAAAQGATLAHRPTTTHGAEWAEAVAGAAVSQPRRPAASAVADAAPVADTDGSTATASPGDAASALASSQPPQGSAGATGAASPPLAKTSSKTVADAARCVSSRPQAAVQAEPEPDLQPATAAGDRANGHERAAKTAASSQPAVSAARRTATVNVQQPSSPAAVAIATPVAATLAVITAPQFQADDSSTADRSSPTVGQAVGADGRGSAVTTAAQPPAAPTASSLEPKPGLNDPPPSAGAGSDRLGSATKTDRPGEFVTGTAVEDRSTAAALPVTPPTAGVESTTGASGVAEPSSRDLSAKDAAGAATPATVNGTASSQGPLVEESVRPSSPVAAFQQGGGAGLSSTAPGRAQAANSVPAVTTGSLTQASPAGASSEGSGTSSTATSASSTSADAAASASRVALAAPSPQGATSGASATDRTGHATSRSGDRSASPVSTTVAPAQSNLAVSVTTAPVAAEPAAMTMAQASAAPVGTPTSAGASVTTGVSPLAGATAGASASGVAGSITAVPSTATATSSGHTPATPDGMAASIVAMYRSGQSSLVLRLDPPGLGTVSVHMALGADTAVNVLFVPTVPQTAHLLQAGLGDLRQAMAASGLTLGQAQIGGGAGGSTSGGNPGTQSGAASRQAATAIIPAEPVQSGDTARGARALA